MKRLLLLSTTLLAISLPAQAAMVEVLTPAVLPGQAFIAAFDEKPTQVVLNGKTLNPFPYRSGWRVVTPVLLSSKVGTQKLTTDFKNTSITKNIVVARGKSLVINLPVPEKLNQTPKQLVQNLASTNETVGAAVQKITDSTRFSSPFALPLVNNRKISSPYGEVRQTGEERITHLGVDFDQPKGSIVAAINDGVVAKAYLDPVYGNSVYVDHGRGIYSLYLHLDTIRVKAGEVVKKGKVVGTLGETGLASASHLHLSIKINGTSVDPLQFVASFR